MGPRQLVRLRDVELPALDVVQWKELRLRPEVREHVARVCQSQEPGQREQDPRSARRVATSAT